MAKINKNSVLPTYQGTYDNMITAIETGIITTASWVYLTDRECLAYVDTDLVPHVMLYEKVTQFETQLQDMKDPETGEVVKVTEYVTESVTPVQKEVTSVKEEVSQIQEAITMITSL